MKYRTLHQFESYGRFSLGIKIQVASEQKLPKLDTEAIRMAAYKATDLIEKEIQLQNIKESPETILEIEENKKLISLFPKLVFVEEIPNCYSDSYYYQHLSWFIITTVVGRFKIGWRKRVINIDWSDTLIEETAQELFPDENVTKGDKYIHAWSLSDAKRYIDKLLP